MESVYFRK